MAVVAVRSPAAGSVDGGRPVGVQREDAVEQRDLEDPADVRVGADDAHAAARPVAGA